MIFIRIIRFFTGYVTFRAYGGFGERFINICTVRGIPLWDVTAGDDEFFACTTIEGYKKIIPCAKKSGMRTRLTGRTGLPFIVFKYRSRVGLIIGAAFLVITLSLLSGRIWLIDVSGNTCVTDEDIIAAVNDAGIRIGSRRSSFNAAQCAITAESRFPEISRIAISIKGSRAEITVKENVSRPEITDNDGYYNVVSSADAQLLVLEPYSGTPQAKLFNPVLRGQTLISGINISKDESVSFVHAHGYAVGRTEKDITSTFDSGAKVYRKKRIKRKYHLYILGKTFSFGRAPRDYDYEFSSESYLSFNNKRMPAGLFYTEYSSAEETDVSLTAEDLNLICLEDYADRAETYVSSRQLVSLRTQINETSSTMTYSGRFVCYENIGREEPFEVTQTDQIYVENRQ